MSQAGAKGIEVGIEDDLFIPHDQQAVDVWFFFFYIGEYVA